MLGMMVGPEWKVVNSIGINKSVLPQIFCAHLKKNNHPEKSGNGWEEWYGNKF